MDVLVVGGGGREHVLVWALQKSPSVDRVYCAPGNAGIANQGECWNIVPGDLQGLASAADEHAIDLVVVGPEAPLTSGISEVFDKWGIPCFGPSKAAAIIEGSKAFAKSFMRRHDIPTAAFEVFGDAQAASDFVRSPPWGFPLVVKADGLAAGKGVMICGSEDEAIQAVESVMVDRAFGAAGQRVVIEEFVSGTEATMMALCDGRRAIPLIPSQDHKQAFEGDEGPNTGGMGAYAPANQVVDGEVADRILTEVLQPTVSGLAEEDRTFRGLLYAGLMLTDDGPRVLEFNCRFGDPEAQAVVPLLDEDFGDLLTGIAEGSAPDRPLNWLDQHCACVILAAAGYPGRHEYGVPVAGLDEVADRDDLLVFHSGTSVENGQLVTAGGRVLGVTALGDDLDEALDRAYGAVDRIHFEGMHFRRDIGRRGKVPTR